MRPKMYNRDYAEGERRFSYLCETKEKSKQHNCAIKNPNGNELDRAVCEEIKKLSEDGSEFIAQLESAKKKIKSGSEEFDLRAENLKNEIADTKQQINNLITSLSMQISGTGAEYISRRIEELDGKLKQSEQSLAELSKITTGNALSESEFDVLRDMLKSFAKSFDTMSIEQKRTAIRTFVKRIVWDGENIHMYLIGSADNAEPSCANSK